MDKDQAGVEMTSQKGPSDADLQRTNTMRGKKIAGVQLQSVRAPAKQTDYTIDYTPKSKKYPIFIAFLLVLYGYYIFFMWVWLALVIKYGDGLLWALFGGALSTFGAMIIGVSWSMRYQKKGWWKDEGFPNQIIGNGYCCWYER